MSKSVVPSDSGAGGAVQLERHRTTTVRRRGSMQQGRALQSLGHAVEYLVDSRLFATCGAEARDEQEAIQILMRASRAVFAECPEVLPVSVRLERWLRSGWSRRGDQAA